MAADQVVGVLADALREIDEASWPVDVHRIAGRFGLRIRYEPRDQPKDLAFLRLSSPPEVVITVRESVARPNYARVRFSIAHEIAHWIIWRRTGLTPSKGDYWTHEAVCNWFAAQLLVPPGRLEEQLRFLRNQRTKEIALPSHIGQWARVSWDVAARAVSALPGEDAAYLRLMRKPTMKVGESPPQSPEDYRITVAFSSVSDALGSFPGQFARVRDQELCSWLTDLIHGEEQHVALSASLGRLRLDEAMCSVIRVVQQEHKSDLWVVSFRAVPPSFSILKSVSKGPRI